VIANLHADEPSQVRSASPAIGALLVGASPWMQEAERAELIAAVVAKPLRWRADKLAARVGLTAAERERLNIRTIGAVDLDKAARKRRRHERKVDANRERRRRNGAKPRPQVGALSARQQQPWLAAGMSRRSWYRHRAAERGTTRCPI
jgi:hypothetical protein